MYQLVFNKCHSKLVAIDGRPNSNIVQNISDTADDHKESNYNNNDDDDNIIKKYTVNSNYNDHEYGDIKMNNVNTGIRTTTNTNTNTNTTTRGTIAIQIPSGNTSSCNCPMTESHTDTIISPESPPINAEPQVLQLDQDSQLQLGLQSQLQVQHPENIAISAVKIACENKNNDGDCIVNQQNDQLQTDDKI